MKARVIARTKEEASKKALRYGAQWFQASTECVRADLLSADLCGIEEVTPMSGEGGREDATFEAEFHVIEAHERAPGTADCKHCGKLMYR